MQVPRPNTCLLLVVALTGIAWLAPRPAVLAGLTARYYANTEWSGTPIVERIETEISTAAPSGSNDAWPSMPPAFSVEWSGYLVVHAAGLHRFATKSDDGSWLWIDEQLVVDNGGMHSVRNLTGEIRLSRGVHPIRVRYVQGGGDRFLQLGQASTHGEFPPIGPLMPRAMPYWQLRVLALWPLALVALWYAALAWMAWRATLQRGRGLAEALRDRTFLAVACAGLVLSAAHISYGLPAYDSLSGDELAPLSTLEASRTMFHDWNLRWPTLHLQLIALVLQPFDWAATLFGLPLVDPAVHALMFIVIRALSLLLLFGTFWLTFDAALTIVDRTAGYFAVALLATMPVVVYFGALANLEVPQMFWATLAFWAWLRFVRQRTLASAIVVGAVIGLGLASKDQLYGFYLAVPAATAVVLARMEGRRPWTVLRDERFIAVGVATIVGFVLGHQLPIEWERFAAHVRSMTTVDSAPFRMFTRDVAGQLALLNATGVSFVWAAGIPAASAFVGGCVTLAVSGRIRLLGSLLLPLATYYVGFLVVILYVYDRFLIAFLPVAALIGGVFLAQVTRASALPRALRVAVPAAVLLPALVSAVGVDAVFRRDARHAAGAWIADNVPCGASVGVTYSTSQVPPLDCYSVMRLAGSTVDAMTRYPDYLVLNDAYVRRFQRTPSGARFMARLQDGELGYARVFRAEASPPRWAPLYWEERFWNGEEDPATILDRPLHAIEVWQRR